MSANEGLNKSLNDEEKLDETSNERDRIYKLIKNFELEEREKVRQSLGDSAGTSSESLFSFSMLGNNGAEVKPALGQNTEPAAEVKSDGLKINFAIEPQGDSTGNLNEPLNSSGGLADSQNNNQQTSLDLKFDILDQKSMNQTVAPSTTLQQGDFPPPVPNVAPQQPLTISNTEQLNSEQPSVNDFELIINSALEGLALDLRSPKSTQITEGAILPETNTIQQTNAGFMANSAPELALNDEALQSNDIGQKIKQLEIEQNEAFFKIQDTNEQPTDNVVEESTLNLNIFQPETLPVETQLNAAAGIVEQEVQPQGIGLEVDLSGTYNTRTVDLGLEPVDTGISAANTATEPEPQAGFEIPAMNNISAEFNYQPKNEILPDNILSTMAELETEMPAGMQNGENDLIYSDENIKKRTLYNFYIQELLKKNTSKDLLSFFVKENATVGKAVVIDGYIYINQAASAKLYEDALNAMDKGYKLQVKNLCEIICFCSVDINYVNLALTLVKKIFPNNRRVSELINCMIKKEQRLTDIIHRLYKMYRSEKDV